MPEKPLTIATYAAGASLAAITLVYVFGPTFFIDGDSSATSSSARKKGVVGLSNPANDCFINSVLQSLAGLGELRIYLIRESHRRRLDDRNVYGVREDEIVDLKKDEIVKLEGLRRGIVTRGLKEILDNLNERPIYKKTISASGFVQDIEVAFRQKISRQQQDAQEFLQLVAERLCDEYHAGQRARSRAVKSLEEEGAKEKHDDNGRGTDNEESRVKDDIARRLETKRNGIDADDAQGESINTDNTSAKEDRSKPQAKRVSLLASSIQAVENNTEEGFPFEGKHESQVQCLTCQFEPKPSVSSFVTLTLNVPQSSSTTLNNCFDGLFQTEYIDDYKCDRCRLEDAITRKVKLLQKQTGSEKSKTESDVQKLRVAIEKDPEKPPEDVELPDMKTVPTRKISRQVRITAFPKVLAIHLSRSIFDPKSSSLKNSAKVSFPETLSLGGILNAKRYKLLGVVTHKGSHNSGHYESFRRQNLYAPFSTPNVFQQGGAYAQTASAKSSAAPSPDMGAKKVDTESDSLKSKGPLTKNSPVLENQSTIPSTSPPGIRTSVDLVSEHPATPHSPSTSAARTSKTESRPGSSTSKLSSKLRSEPPKEKAHETTEMAKFRKRKKNSDRWWRISDEKVKECKTSEVLGMQKEVYLLFYEMERPNENDP